MCYEPAPHQCSAMELVFNVGSTLSSDGVARVACLQVRVVAGSGEQVADGPGNGGGPRPELEPGRNVSGWQLLDGLRHQGRRADELDPHRIGDRLLDRCIPADDIPQWERQVRPGWLFARPIVVKRALADRLVLLLAGSVTARFPEWVFNCLAISDHNARLAQ